MDKYANNPSNGTKHTVNDHNSILGYVFLKIESVAGQIRSLRKQQNYYNVQNTKVVIICLN